MSKGSIRSYAIVSLLGFLLGEARPSVSTDQRSSNSKPLSQPPSKLWQIADESLTIIEESLIAQSEPVESLSESLPELYQKFQELQASVNALSLRFGSLEEYLTNLERNMTQAILAVNASNIELMTWKILAIVGITGTVIGVIEKTFNTSAIK